jgi:hypothetical protein
MVLNSTMLASFVSICEWKHYKLVTEFQGFGAVIGTISRNLADLQDLQLHQGNYISIYTTRFSLISIQDYMQCYHVCLFQCNGSHQNSNVSAL